MRIVFPLFLLLLCFEVLTTFGLNAAVTVEPVDTVLPRGGVHPAAVYGSLNGATGSTIELKFAFNAAVIDIKGISPCETCIMSSPTFTVNMSKMDSTILTIKADISTTTGLEKFCVLEVEGLVGPDTVTPIIPTEVIIDGETIQDVEFINGKIRVLTDPIVQKLPEGLGNPYPNPFAGSVTVPFFVSEETKVSFYIYNSLGRLYASYPETDGNTFLFYNGDGVFIGKPDTNIFQKGEYKIKILPTSIDCASGSYYIFMKTAKKTYSTGFMIVR